MKLTVLGSGTCVPYVKRGSSGYVVETGESKLMLDCGSGSTWKLAHAGINYLEIDHIFFSHIHPDHTGDLAAFLFATKYSHGSPYGTGRKKPLSLWGGKGFPSFFSALKGAYDKWIEPEGLSVEELRAGPKDFADFKLTAARSEHIKSSLAYRIEAEGKSLVYSGDTDYSEELIKLAWNTDLLLIECALTQVSKHKGHLTPGGVSKIVNASRAKRVVVTHLYPVCDREDVVGQIRENVEVEVIEAEDLLEIEV